MNPNEIFARAQPVLDRFYDAVRACSFAPPFKPAILISDSPGPIRYDHAARAVVLVPYELLHPAAKAGMDRYGKLGTLGLSGRDQYEEIFQSLLVAHELGHWLQNIASRPLTRWEAEYGANRIMVAFWREFPAPAPAPTTDARLANFTVQPPNFPRLVPEGITASAESYFDQACEEIEKNPAHYASFQKYMVRLALEEEPKPRFCYLVRCTGSRAAGR